MTTERGDKMRRWMAEARAQKKLTQQELALEVNVSQRAIAAYELGDRNPSVKTAQRLGEVLCIPWTRFYEEPEEEKA